MGLENLQRWHWMLISLVIGSLLGYAQMYDLSGKRITPDESFSDRRTIGIAVLMQKLSAPKTEKGYPWIADLTIYPPIEGKICVAGNELQPVQAKDGVASYRAFQQVTEVPFKRTGESAPSATYSFVDYLKDLKRTNPEVAYRHAWWANPPITIGLWTGGSFLVIGLLFPTFLSVLQGTGYMPKRADKSTDLKPAYSYGGDQEIEGLVKSGKSPMTVQDQNQLDELTSHLEKALADGSVRSGAAVTSNPSESPAKQLDNKPLEQVTPAIDPSKEDLEWGGEFYPVAHSKHKDEKY